MATVIGWLVAASVCVLVISLAEWPGFCPGVIGMKPEPEPMSQLAKYPASKRAKSGAINFLALKFMFFSLKLKLFPVLHAQNGGVRHFKRRVFIGKNSFDHDLVSVQGGEGVLFVSLGVQVV